MFFSNSDSFVRIKQLITFFALYDPIDSIFIRKKGESYFSREMVSSYDISYTRIYWELDEEYGKLIRYVYK